jgi:type IV secretory pathway ATPase VirB11/archaellum biosynthesis ATPase
MRYFFSILLLSSGISKFEEIGLHLLGLHESFRGKREKLGLEKLNPAGARVKTSGPLKVLEFDCHGCPASSSFQDRRCRRCVLEKLGTEGNVDQVVLGTAFHHVCSAPSLSELAHAFVMAKRLALDRTAYGGDGEKCEKCIQSRMDTLMEIWPKLLENPHDLSPLDGLKIGMESSKCRECTESNFQRVLDSIKSCITSTGVILGSSIDYDELFEVRTKPFFVEGIWHKIKRDARLLESYELPNSRGKVKIFEQKGRPVPFYDLELPEFKLSPEEVELLDQAFRMEIKEAPGHAKFAYSERMREFAGELYQVLLFVTRNRSGKKVSSERLHELSRYMGGWLTYHLLEPLSYDDRVTDVYISAPPELQPIYLEHERWGRCETNIYWSTPILTGLGETLASRLGTAFDEVHPQLDAEIPELGMRLFLSRYPAIWSRSIEVAIRKRRSKPWTQPLFLARRTLTPLASSLLGNFLRIGSSAFIIGEVGTAKTSQIETYIPEIGPDKRIICYQDTEELHLQDFMNQGYKLTNVRVSDPDHLQTQINAFLRGGSSYWLITEVRASEAVKATLGAAARQGSQPVVASFHARSKREMFDLVCHIFGLHEAAYKYVDLIVSTARFTTPRGIIRRITEITEVLKDWEEKPRYVELFRDDRARDFLVQEKFLKGDKRVIQRLNSLDLSKVDVLSASKKVEFLSPEKGGSQFIPFACKKLAVDLQDFLTEILLEARMKSDLLNLARKGGEGYLELPFISRAYDAYFSSIKRNVNDYRQVKREWEEWLRTL